jgi:hypothetical protein
MALHEVTPGEARTALRALGRGAVPAELAESLAVGQADWFSWAVREMSEVAEDEDFSVRFVRAKYGGGKTHFLRRLEHRARGHGWVTAFVLLKHKQVELDHFATVTHEIARSLELPDRSRGLPALLRAALSMVAGQAGHRPEGPSQAIKVVEKTQDLLDGLGDRHGLGDHLRLALRLAALALLDHDAPLFAQVAAWLGGAPDRLVVAPARLEKRSRTRAAPVTLKPLGAGSADELLRLLALLARWAGHRGFLLTLDEVELIGRLPRRRRDNAMQTLRALVDQTDPRLRPPSTCLFLASTPEMFEDRDMFPGYKALQDRIAELPALDGAGGVNYLAPVIDLDRTELGHAELRQLADNILLLHRTAGQETPPDLVARVGRLVDAVLARSYVIARPRLLCRSLLDLLRGQLGGDPARAVALLAEKLREERNQELEHR